MRLGGRPSRAIVFVILLAGIVAFAFAQSHERAPAVLLQKDVLNWQDAARQVGAMRRDNADAWQKLDAEAAAAGGAPPQRVTAPGSAPELLQYMGWLRGKILAGHADARYAYATAIDLGFMLQGGPEYLQGAAVFIYNARLSLAIDGARCAGQGSAETVAAEYESQNPLRDLAQKVAALSPRDKASALLEAIAIEQVRGAAGPTRAWLCNRAPPAAPRAGQPVLAGGAPQFLPEREWRKSRARILERETRRAAADL